MPSIALSGSFLLVYNEFLPLGILGIELKVKEKYDADRSKNSRF